MLKLHNTLTRNNDSFEPIKNDQVSLYTCGPTVYDFLHVGNWAAYIYWDTLVRTLLADGYNVDRVMNITDVGHLVSDADDGQDKLEKGAKREGKTAWEVAEFYTEDFLAGMNKLNLIPPTHITKATNYIDEQLDLIRKLKQKGYLYQIDDGIYFDTSLFPSYADFARLNLEAQKAGARVDFNSQKRHVSDFAVWKFTPDGQTRDMEWETPQDILENMPTSGDNSHSNTERSTAQLSEVSVARAQARHEAVSSESKPLANQSFETSAARTWSEAVSNNSIGEEATKTTTMGFPGWHLECSAMALTLLGDTIDIHTGGIDHIPVHHTNEIAQSEGATGQIFSHYWLHNNHLKVDGTKISKSLGNGYTLSDIQERGYSPMDYRMFVLQSHYQSEGNFSFENLEAAKNHLNNWRNIAAMRHQQTSNNTADFDADQLKGEVLSALNDNLNTPKALQIVDSLLPKLVNASAIDIKNVVDSIDTLLGLQLLASTPDIDDSIKNLITERNKARSDKDWSEADRLRDELASHGIQLKDAQDKTFWQYI